MKKLLLIAIAGSLGAATLLAGVQTARRSYAERPDHPLGLSLRDDSVRSARGAGFFYMYGRSHRGGGLRSGK